MTVNVVPHLNVRGDARDALAFYHSNFGGERTIVTDRDAGQVQDPAEADQVVWGQVASADGFRVMAYDVPARRPWNPGETAFFASVRGGSVEEVTAYWNGLGAGATVLQPLAPSAWSAAYGMVKDRYGITWVVDGVSDFSAS